MLYTVVPLERIYSYRTESVLTGRASQLDDVHSFNSKESELASMSLSSGRVYAKRYGEEYLVDGIFSTDMSDYLNPMYVPGSVINIH